MAGEEKKAAIVAVTDEQVKGLIAEALKGFAPVEMVKALIQEGNAKLVVEVKALIAEADVQLVEYVEARLSAAPLPVPGVLITSGEKKSPFDPAWIEGLTFKGAEQVKKIVEGRPTMVSTPFERDLFPEDVLGWRVGEGNVTLIAADGQKHVVEI